MEERWDVEGGGEDGVDGDEGGVGVWGGGCR